MCWCGPSRQEGGCSPTCQEIARLLRHLLLPSRSIPAFRVLHEDKATADGAIADTLKEIEEVRKGGVTREEFERAKKWMIGSYEIGLQSNSAYAEKMMYNELYGVGYEETFRAPEKIQAVTLEEVNRVAAKVLSTERYTLAILRGK
jgi:predicted Zn-dependent peptidase